MGKTFSARLKAGAKAARDIWAKTLGPILISVMAVQLAFAAGQIGVWWLSACAAALCGFALSWTASVAEARAQTHWAGVLIKTLASGEDSTITVEHIHTTKGEQP